MEGRIDRPALVISSDPRMTPTKAAQKPHQVSALAGIAPPRKIADSVTEAAANNATAAGYRKGAVRPGMIAPQGFSAGAQQQMQAAQQQASGVGEGAQQAAGIRAVDLMFNATQQGEYEQRVQGRLNSNYALQTGMNQANFQKQMARMSGHMNMNLAQQQAWQQLRLALLSRTE